MCTLKIQLYLQAEVLRVQCLFSDSQEGNQVRTCLQNAYSGKSCPPDLLFHSIEINVQKMNMISDDILIILTKNMLIHTMCETES